MIDGHVLQNEVARLLTVLYEKRFGALGRLTLTKLLSKNPYLYRALGLTRPSDFIEQVLVAFVSSSDETIFGNDFLEPLAIFSAQQAALTGAGGATVTVGAGAGQDIAIETATHYMAISVKSGKNIFNAQSDKGQSAEFKAMRARLKKLGKTFKPVIGYGYGRKRANPASEVEKLAGQAFWHMLTGEQDYFLRISQAMGHIAGLHGAAYKAAFEKTYNALLKQFMGNFVADDGEIQWEKLVEFNSAVQRPASLKVAN